MGLATIALRVGFVQICRLRIRTRGMARSKEKLDWRALETALAVLINDRRWLAPSSQPNGEFAFAYFFGNRIISLAL